MLASISLGSPAALNELKHGILTDSIKSGPRPTCFGDLPDRKEDSFSSSERPHPLNLSPPLQRPSLSPQEFKKIQSFCNSVPCLDPSFPEGVLALQFFSPLHPISHAEAVINYLWGAQGKLATSPARKKVTLSELSSCCCSQLSYYLRIAASP